MALRTAAANTIKVLTHSIKNNRAIGTITETTPKLKAYTPTLDQQAKSHNRRSLKEELLPKGKSLGDYVPVYVALGMITLAVSFGLHTAKQELLHGPDVRVKKTRRETLPEVDKPDYVAREAEDYVKKSLFRKVAHIQQSEGTIPNPIRGDPLSKEPKVESLKTVGVACTQVSSAAST